MSTFFKIWLQTRFSGSLLLSYLSRKYLSLSDGSICPDSMKFEIYIICYVQSSISLNIPILTILIIKNIVDQFVFGYSYYVQTWDTSHKIRSRYFSNKSFMRKRCINCDICKKNHHIAINFKSFWNHSRLF